LGFIKAWCAADAEVACEGDTRADDNVAARRIPINSETALVKRMLLPLADVLGCIGP